MTKPERLVTRYRLLLNQVGNLLMAASTVPAGLPQLAGSSAEAATSQLQLITRDLMEGCNVSHEQMVPCTQGVCIHPVCGSVQGCSVRHAMLMSLLLESCDRIARAMSCIVVMYSSLAVS